MGPVTHVIFDLDGLLLNTEETYNRVYQEVCLKLGRCYDPSLATKIRGRPEADTFKIIVADLQLPVEEDEFARHLEIELTALLPNCQLMPGAKRLLDHLQFHGIPMAIATSSRKDSFKLKTGHIDSQTGFYHYFNHMLTGGSDPRVKRGKPAPDIFIECRKMFPPNTDGSLDPPNKFLVFEDAVAGVVGAVAAGMKVVMIPDENVDVEHERKDPAFRPTIVLRSLLDFKPELFGLPPFPQEKRQ